MINKKFVALMIAVQISYGCASKPRQWIEVSDRSIASVSEELKDDQENSETTKLSESLKISFLPIEDKRLPIKIHLKNNFDKDIDYNRNLFHFFTTKNTSISISKDNEYDAFNSSWNKVSEDYLPREELKVLALDGEAKLKPKRYLEDIIYLDLTEMMSLDEIDILVDASLVKAKSNMQLRFVYK